MDFTDPARIITFITDRLPGAIAETASEASGAPEIAWGDTFVFGAAGQRMPFATIVTKDYPDFDAGSRLGRPGAFRLNVNVGKARFTDLIGYPPADHAQHAAEFDYAAADTLLPHPAYAVQAWVSIVNPGPRTTELAASLLTEAHQRATRGRGSL